MNLVADAEYYLSNNIISNLWRYDEGASHISLINGGTGTNENFEMKNNLFYQGGQEIRIRTSSAIHNLDQFDGNYPAKTSGLIKGNPAFVDEDGDDYSLTSGSSAVDAGDSSLLDQVAAYFISLYSPDFTGAQGEAIDIRKGFIPDGLPKDGDNDGVPEWDIGAIEFNGTAPPQCIEMSDLLNYISQWRQGSISMPAVMEALRKWKSGEGC